ncbi:MAG: AsmA family protein [Acidobacteriia bacterium]|nr:AsmA family protein [Terriglobia bacterium]
MSRRLRWLAGLAAAGLLAALLLPFWAADRFALGLQSRLQQTLGRQVEMKGKVRVRLLPRPGFEAAEVVIHEDPQFSVEPFAYVTTLELDASLGALLLGRLEMAAIRLIEPSVNLMQGSAGWNVQRLLDHVLKGPGSGASIPAIEMRGGRINLKTGDLKSVLYLADTDLRVEASGSNADQIDLRFTGEPARTDRPARAFGELSGRGWLRRPASGEATLDLSLAIQRSSIQEILTLAQGRSSGLGGFVASRATLRGPLSKIAITGRMELDEIERFGWLIPSRGAWALDYRGNLNLREQTAHLETFASGNTILPWSVRVRAYDLANQPRWAALLTLDELPYASLRSLAAEMGAAFPKDLPIDGKISGVLGYSASAGVQGQLQLMGSAFELPGLGSATLDEASLLIAGTRTELRPTVIRLNEKESVRLETVYDSSTGEMDVQLRTAGMGIETLQAAWKSMAGSLLPGILGACQMGNWSGDLRHRKGPDQDGLWAGQVTIRETTCRVDGLKDPVKVDAAVMRLRAGAPEYSRISARLGEMALTAHYTNQSSAKRPHKLQITIAEASVEELSNALEPALLRSQGFLDRTLRRNVMLPVWLRNRSLEASLQVSTLKISNQVLEGFRGRLFWDGDRVEIRDITATAGKGTVSGNLVFLLSGREPTFEGRIAVQNAHWREGRLDMEADVSGSGTSQSSKWRLSGAFQARDIVLSPEAEWRTWKGCFLYQSAGAAERLQLTALEAQSGSEVLTGQGHPSAEGRFNIEMNGAQRQIRLAGKAQGLTLEFAGSK